MQLNCRIWHFSHIRRPNLLVALGERQIEWRQFDIWRPASLQVEDLMSPKFSAVSHLPLLAIGALVAVHLATSAGAESLNYDKRGRPSYGAGGPNYSYQQGKTRIYVSKRSWLDGGTEVLPGDRKFTDYAAYPPALGLPSFDRQIVNRPIDRQPLNPPSDMGGYHPTEYPLY
jgi:hypothetical protein